MRVYKSRRQYSKALERALPEETSNYVLTANIGREHNAKMLTETTLSQLASKPMLACIFRFNHGCETLGTSMLFHTGRLLVSSSAR